MANLNNYNSMFKPPSPMFQTNPIQIGPSCAAPQPIYNSNLNTATVPGHYAGQTFVPAQTAFVSGNTVTIPGHYAGQTFVPTQVIFK